MPSLSYEIKLGSISIQKTHTGDAAINTEITLPAGKSGTLSTRTDNNTGVATVSSGHGITDTDTVDVYWDGGVRYSMDVTATTSTTISIDLGSGDNLPTASTAIVVCKQVAFNCQIDGDNLSVLGLQYEVSGRATTGYGSRVQLLDSGAAVIAGHTFAANGGLVYDKAAATLEGRSNPYTGNVVTNGVASNGDGTNDATLKIQGIQDATP